MSAIAKRLFLPVTWAALLCVAMTFIGFLHGQDYERQKPKQLIAGTACDTPSDRLTIVEVFLLPNGQLGCQRRMR